MNKIWFLILIFYKLYIFKCSENYKKIVKLKVGLKNRTIEFEGNQSIYAVSTNYKHLNLDFSNFSNIDKIQITDKLNFTSNLNVIDICSRKSNLCHIQNIIKNSEIHFESKMCVYSIYIILRSSNNFNISSFLVSINFIHDKEYESCQYIHETPYAFCGESEISDCRNCLRNSCSLIQCGRETEIEHQDIFETLYELCVPLSITDKNKKRLCSYFNEVNNYRNYDDCFFSERKYDYLHAEIYLLIVLFILLSAFGIIFYNTRIIRSKQKYLKLFPSFPKFLCPKINSN